MGRNILIISNNCFSKYTNNGKTLESIFSAVKINCLSQLYFTDKFSPDFDFCNNYYRILNTDVFKSVLIRQKKVGGIINRQTFKKNDNTNNGSTYQYRQFNSSPTFLRLIRDMLWATNTWKTDDLINWCINQKPDLIFFVAGGGKFAHNIALYLMELLKVPIVIFFTDDYIIYPKIRNIFDFIQNFRMKKFFRSSISKSSLCFAIGDDMCEAYSTYFNTTFWPIMNSAPIKTYVEKVDDNDKIIINYFGSIHTNRWLMIIKLGEILRSIDKDRFSINVFVGTKPQKRILRSFACNGINYKGGLIGDELQNTILNSDILLHVESNDAYSKSRTKLSVSTKIPEYLMSGRPILGFGPKDVASMSLLMKNKIGIVISPTDNLEIIKFQLNKLLNEPKYRERLGLSGYKYAIENYDINKITKDFNSKIEKLFEQNYISNK